MTTKTRGKHAAAPAVKPSTEIFEMDERFAAIFDELSEVQLARKAAQDREKELKELIMAEVPEEQDKGVTFALRVANAIRGKVTVRVRTGIDQKTLMEVFPEAYEQVRTETSYKVLS